MKSETVQKILDQTKNDYDAIAADFNKTRSYLWPGLKGFKKYVSHGDKVLDLGCGNGKLRLLFKDVKIDYIGVDNSQRQLDFVESRSDFKIASQKFVHSEIFRLPFSDNSFDVIFFLAVLHHIPSQNLRLKALEEIRRVLKPSGVLIIMNWNRYQSQWPQLKYIIKYTALKIIGRSDLDFKDIYLPWMGGKVYRYYHAFTLGELKNLIGNSGLILVDNYLAAWAGKKANRFSYLKSANLVTIAKK